MVRCVVVTCSDTRTEKTDTSGATIRQSVEAAGHIVLDYHIISDDPDTLRRLILDITAHRGENRADVILITGGTGLSPRDTAYDVLKGLYSTDIPGFGELFRMLSHDQVGAAAMLSRASAGIVEQTIVYSMPGSQKAVQLAMDSLITPTLGHVAAIRT